MNVEQARNQSGDSRFRAIFDSAGDAIVVINAQGLIEAFSPAAEYIFEMSAAEAVGQDVSTLLPTPFDEEHNDSIATHLKHDRETLIGSVLEVTAQRKGGEAFPIRLFLNSLRVGDRVFFTAIIRDLSREKAVEQQLYDYALALEGAYKAISDANDELEESNARTEMATRSKSEFLANMSHEIRTPMTAILGFTDMIRGRNGTQLAQAQHNDAIDTIHRNGQHLLQLINEILDLSRIDAGQLMPSSEPLDSAALVSESVSLLKQRADVKELSLTVAWKSPPPKRVLGDALRIKQILINLIGNAIKFTDKGDVRVEAEWVDDAQQGQRLRVDIVDTGVGMTAQQAIDVFEPFRQADTSATRMHGGTGLGLTICRSLARVMNGDVTIVETKIGAGTRFRLEIPAFAAPDSERDEGNRIGGRPSELAADNSDLTSTNILLVEDGPDNQRLVSFILSHAGAKVTLAENGSIGVDKAMSALRDGRPYDVILMDMQMPVMDGYEAARTLRESGYERAIVAVTAHAMDGDRQKCLDAGCDDYMTKPVHRGTLYSKVRQWRDMHPSVIVK